MSDFLTTDLAYHADSTLMYDRVAGEPWAVFLDSGQPTSLQGRYDIIAARPSVRITTRNRITKIETWSGGYVVPDEPLAVLKEQLAPVRKYEGRLPFVGGAIGVFSYDLGRYIEDLPATAANDLKLPDMVMGIYPWAVIVDHRQRQATLVGDKSDVRVRKGWNDLKSLFAGRASVVNHPVFNVVGRVHSNMTEKTYGAGFRRIKRYIREGDCYQVNFAQRFSVSVQGSPWLAYRVLRRINPSPFSAYMNYPDFQVLSNSPERFLSVRGGSVCAKPIKGTRPRAKRRDKDQSLRRELADSKKDRAENIMIVDLLRNDISKNCEKDSVKVPKLCDIESFPNVHHLVSTITGRLRARRSAIDLLRGCFPGGSITGAPKLRAMEVIEELEPHHRGVYCGAIGYIGFDGGMDTSIAIRTIVHKDECMYFHVGGGIVHDSEAAAEYRETLDKATAMMELLGHGKSYAMGH